MSRLNPGKDEPTLTEQEIRDRIARRSQDPRDYRELAFLVGVSGRKEEAAEVLRQGISVSPPGLDRAAMHVELGWILYDLSREGEAANSAQLALSILSTQPENLKVVFVRGEARALVAHATWRSQPTLGLEIARTAIADLDSVILNLDHLDLPGKEISLLDAARVHILMGNTRDAILRCKEYLRRSEDQSTRVAGLVELATALRMAARYAEACETIREATELRVSDRGHLPRLYLEMALIRRSTGRPGDALAALEKTLAELEAHPVLRSDEHLLTETYWLAGELQYERAQYEDAARAFQKVIGVHSTDDRARRNALIWLGNCYFALGEAGAARACYEEVLESPDVSEPEREAAHRGLAGLA